MTISRLIDCLKKFPEDKEVLVSSDDGMADFFIEEKNEKVILASEKSIEDTIDDEYVAEQFSVAKVMEAMSEKITIEEFFGEYDDDPGWLAG